MIVAVGVALLVVGVQWPAPSEAIDGKAPTAEIVEAVYVIEPDATDISWLLELPAAIPDPTADQTGAVEFRTSTGIECAGRLRWPDDDAVNVSDVDCGRGLMSGGGGWLSLSEPRRIRPELVLIAPGVVLLIGGTAVFVVRPRRLP